MRTTLNIDDQLLAEAQRITGVTEKSAMVREGLRTDRVQKRPAPGATWLQ